MGIFLAPNREGECCLCGATENLSGEHKIKASALRAEFGSDKLVIGTFDSPDSAYRTAQGPKSKEFHFKAPMCAKCNNERTQAADREFDRFHKRVRAILSAGGDPSEVFNDARYAEESEPYLNVFRHFAKLLCCHLAEVAGPRRIHLARFALGEVHRNCVWLQIKVDWTYQQMATAFGPQQYAAHGGLVIYGNKDTGEPQAFHSTRTIGEVQYVFHSRLTWPELVEMRCWHREFYDWCRRRAAETIEAPMSEAERLRLGFAPDDAAET